MRVLYAESFSRAAQRALTPWRTLSKQIIMYSSTSPMVAATVSLTTTKLMTVLSMMLRYVFDPLLWVHKFHAAVFFAGCDQPETGDNSTVMTSIRFSITFETFFIRHHCVSQCLNVAFFLSLSLSRDTLSFPSQTTWDNRNRSLILTWILFRLSAILGAGLDERRHRQAGFTASGLSNTW